MWYPEWKLNQQNKILFVMVDGNYTEVPGLGVAFNLFISKNGGVFNPSAGVKAEISDGWYSYITTAAEANTIGPVAVYVTGAGCIQQNLEYVVQQRNAGCKPFTYTVTNSVTHNPIPSVEVWITSDALGANVIWHGETDALGVAYDIDGHLPCLDDGTYYFWKHEPGLIDDDNPDTEVVS
jgi:hypothetical protein